MVTAMIVLVRLGPRIATARMASTRSGTDMMRSITRVTSTSTRRIEGRREAQHDAEPEGDDHHREADEQRHARAVDQAREDVAPEPVGAEQEAPGAALHPDRRRLDGVAELLERRMGRDQRRRRWRPARSARATAAPSTAPLFSPEGMPEGGQRGRRRAGGRLTSERRRGDVSGHGGSAG